MADRPPLSPQDYDAIEAAVMETSRGRWFLSEYARRNRNADTQVLLDALQRIDETLRRQSFSEDVVRLRRDLDDMASGLAHTKRDLATSLADAAGQGQPLSVERAYDDVIRAAEKADGDVFAAAEHVQEIAWSLRENGEADQASEDLDRQALELYRASNQHALTTNRVRAIIGVLRFMETRIAEIMGSWSSVPDGGEAPMGQGFAPEGRRTLIEAAPPRIRDDIVFVEAAERTPLAGTQLYPPPAPRAERPAPPVPRVPSVPADPRAAAFAALDALSTEQKLALFA